MSIDATNWAWSQRDVTPSEKLILLSYADRAGESHEAWPSWSRLILDTGLDRKTIYYCLLSLQKKGKIMKTGEKKKQVYVYKLLGVTGREDKKLSTTSSKNGTSHKITTSSENGTSTSSENGTTDSSKNGTKNHQLKPKRNPNEKPLIFLSLDHFKIHVEEEVRKTKKEPRNSLVEEIIFYAEKSKEKRELSESLSIAITQIKKGLWKTPHEFNGITSESIRKKEDEYQKQKEIQMQLDAKIVRAIKKDISSGKEFHELKKIKDILNGKTINQAGMPT